MIDCLKPDIEAWNQNLKSYGEKSNSMAKKRALEPESEALLRKEHDRAKTYELKGLQLAD